MSRLTCQGCLPGACCAGAWPGSHLLPCWLVLLQSRPPHLMSRGFESSGLLQDSKTCSNQTHCCVSGMQCMLACCLLVCVLASLLAFIFLSTMPGEHM